MMRTNIGKKTAGLLLGAALLTLVFCPSVQAGTIGRGAAEINNQTSEQAAAAAATPGWHKSAGVWYYCKEDGTRLTNALTPDGYYVDGNGEWSRNKLKFAGLELTYADQYLVPSDIRWSMTPFLEAGNLMYNQVSRVLPGYRDFHFYVHSLEYCKVSDINETVLLGLYADPKQNCWQVKVAEYLGKRDGNYKNASTCDYEVLRFLLSRFSHTPDLLADAIYQDWQAENKPGFNMATPVTIGDSLVTVSAEQGAAIYRFTKRTK